MAVGHQDFTQKKPDQLVYLELGVGNGGMLLTISEDGFRFRAVTPVRANTSMPFAFSLDGRNRLEGEGTVEWVEEDGKSGGMRFTEVSPEFHATLGVWLNSDVSHQAGREVTPDAATPLDTMEKIRQELRAGYPRRPADATPAARVPDQKPAPRAFPHTVAQKNVSEKSSPDKNFPEKNVTEKSLPAQKKPTIFARTSEKMSDSKEPLTARRLFPLSSANSTESQKPATVSSAFLKPAGEAKTPAVAPAPVMPAKTVESVPTVPAKREAPYTPASSVLFRTAPKPPGTPVAAEPPAAELLVATETFAATHARPFIPPLEESFEQAWERGKLSSPPDSPHLSRAAAGSIIAIALAIIFGALAYNFRQDIGSIFIQLGQSISGENRTAAPAPSQESKPDTTPSAEANQTTSQPAASQSAASQPQNAPAELGNVGKSSASSTNKNTAAGAATLGPSGVKSGGAAPPVVNVPENSAPSVAADLAAKTGGADSGIGQEEFAAAQDVLRGGNRQRDLSRAVALLWSSVKKGYVPAEVTLADLYRRGDGVEKNCDQARVLLVAASKKGSFEARQILEQIAEQGCE
jgi:hypothetical protein